ncbi:cardiolipin synthase [Methylomarinum vadi]|uniref:cardiolipin synthase n=1 Tax=Methylomarinum vadi TaxID=438855 RepID=UPI00068DD59B|nr:cardiolipin synthase [Methylomarinum vadi]
MPASLSATEIIWLLSWLAALFTVPSVLLQRAGRPIAALSWLLALFALPGLAVGAWWLFGRVHLRRKKRQRRRASQESTASLLVAQQRLSVPAKPLAPAPGPVSRAVTLPPALNDAVFPPSQGNRVSLLQDTPAVHHAWRGLVEDARHHLHLLFYLWRDDQTGRDLLNRLVAKARSGVEVRVLYDAVGSWRLPRYFFEPLTAAGGKAVAFLPFKLFSSTPTLNFRNHRKLLIADGVRAYTGGVNVGDEYLDWQDIGVFIEGAGVNQLQEVFVDDWFFAAKEELAAPDYFCDPGTVVTGGGGALCEIVASGPDQAFNATREMLFLAITQCRKRLWISTPYFVPDGALLLALRTAVYRGVDVRLFVPRESDVPLVQGASRVFYFELLEAGIKVFEFAGMLHAKAVLLDDEDVLIGSANLDTRSFRLNFELNTFVTDPVLAGGLAGLFERLRARSRPVAPSELLHAAPLSRLKDAIVHLLAPLL